MGPNNPSESVLGLSHLTTLLELERLIVSRGQALPSGSYVTALLKKQDGALLKVGEESTEFIIAAKNAQLVSTDVVENGAKKQAVIGEMADLLFHSMVALSELDLSLADVIDELGHRRRPNSE